MRHDQQRKDNGEFKTYKCNETIDLEEYLDMHSEDKPTKIKAVATYVSGRTEEIHGKINSDGQADARFRTRLEHLRAFPTVTKVDVTRY